MRRDGMRCGPNETDLNHGLHRTTPACLRACSLARSQTRATGPIYSIHASIAAPQHLTTSAPLFRSSAQYASTSDIHKIPSSNYKIITQVASSQYKYQNMRCHSTLLLHIIRACLSPCIHYVTLTHAFESREMRLGWRKENTKKKAVVESACVVCCDGWVGD